MDNINATKRTDIYQVDPRNVVVVENFKLCTVAKEMGIKIEEEKLHDAQYDNYLTYEIYKVVTSPVE